MVRGFLWGFFLHCPELFMGRSVWGMAQVHTACFGMEHTLKKFIYKRKLKSQVIKCFKNQLFTNDDLGWFGPRCTVLALSPSHLSNHSLLDSSPAGLPGYMPLESPDVCMATSAPGWAQS